MVELQTDSLVQVLAEKPLVLVQYGATWCGHCRMIKPKFSKLSAEHVEVEFVYVDAEKFPESRKLAEVTHLPTFAAFRDGRLIKQYQGNKIDQIDDLIRSIEGVGAT